ncbi:PH-like domain-containing protein [Microbacterium sp. CJ88]|uniref:PH-like domain-containing protein n=1 Tax=Microbacterium sp. CJ88 TaxID=3445672 RepID=UPI003F656CB0
MSRELVLTLWILIAVALLGLLAWAWWRRIRRDAGLIAPVGEAPAGASSLATFSGLYVATTVHDQPLERLAIRRLGFRSRVDVTVTDAGIALDLTGAPRIFLDASRLTAADQSTVAIDRVVERDGLARLAWRIDDATIVDTYLRPQDASARALVDAVRPIIPPAAPTGSDA